MRYEVIRDEIEQEICGDTSDAFVLGLAHRAVLFPQPKMYSMILQRLCDRPYLSCRVVRPSIALLRSLPVLVEIEPDGMAEGARWVVRTLKTKDHGSPRIPCRGRKRRGSRFDVAGSSPEGSRISRSRGPWCQIARPNPQPREWPGRAAQAHKDERKTHE
jgi:hypothetical protein